MKPSIPRPPMTPKERALALQDKRLLPRSGYIRKVTWPKVVKAKGSKMVAPNGRISYSHVQRKKT
jgi:hypothetical protein